MKNRDNLRSLMLAERDRWVLWLPVAMAAGIALYFNLPEEPDAFLGWLGILTSAGVAWQTRRQRSVPWLVAIALIAFFSGFGAAQWRTARIAAPVIEKRLRAVVVEGRIVNIENRTRGLRVTLDRLRISTLGPRRIPAKVRLTLAGNQPELNRGDWISGRFGLSPPPPPAAPGAFDFQRRAFFQGIGGVGFSYGSVMITEKTSFQGMAGVLSRLINLRNTIALRINDYFQARNKRITGSVVTALMTGKRGAIPENIMQTFRDAGLAHLLAISGLHIGLIAGILFFGVRAALALAGTLALKYPIKKWAAIAALGGAFVYTLIAGATVPTIRAFMMIGLVLVAVLVDRRGLSMRLVAFAAAAILAVQPEALLGASFQLSFAAVIALIAAYEALSQWRRSTWRSGLWPVSVWKKLLLYFAGVALTTLIAGSATAPFAAFHFNQFPHYSLAANIVAVPLTALWIMPWAVLAFVLMPVGLEAVALAPMGWGVDLVLLVADRVSHWPGAVSLLPAMPNWALACLAMGGLWLCLWRRRWRFLGVAGLAVGMASIVFVKTPDVLVDHRGRLLAVKDAKGGLALSSRRTARFTGKVWLRRAALDHASPWSGSNLSCDSLGCLYSNKGKIIALVTDFAALAEDCAVAAVVISTVPVQNRCTGPERVIDRFDLWRNGAHALWVGDQEIRVESVNGYRGNRPWVHRPPKGKNTKSGT